MQVVELGDERRITMTVVWTMAAVLGVLYFALLVGVIRTGNSPAFERLIGRLLILAGFGFFFSEAVLDGSEARSLINAFTGFTVMSGGFLCERARLRVRIRELKTQLEQVQSSVQTAAASPAS
jgi:recombinational DNA repair protein (RecF pathway)